METKIISSCTFISFARELQSMNYNQFVNKETGEKFIKLTCVKKDGTQVEVSNSSKLEPLSLQELYAKAKELGVYKLESGSFKLAKMHLGEEVDLSKLLA